LPLTPKLLFWLALCGDALSEAWESSSLPDVKVSSGRRRVLFYFLFPAPQFFRAYISLNRRFFFFSLFPDPKLLLLISCPRALQPEFQGPSPSCAQRGHLRFPHVNLWRSLLIDIFPPPRCSMIIGRVPILVFALLPPLFFFPLRCGSPPCSLPFGWLKFFPLGLIRIRMGPLGLGSVGDFSSTRKSLIRLLGPLANCSASHFPQLGHFSFVRMKAGALTHRTDSTRPSRPLTVFPFFIWLPLVASLPAVVSFFFVPSGR